MMKISLTRPMRVEGGQGPPRYPVKEALATVRYYIYKGHRYECSCCGRSFKLLLFSPYMTALCPYCLSVERYRLLCRYLREQTDFGSKKTRLLDIAPMWCFQEFCRSHANVDYVSIDIASPLAMRHMDIRDLEFKDNFFDYLICYHVIEHIDDDQKALLELYRVLKPGGWAIIQVPIHRKETVERRELTKEEAQEILKFDDHKRAYGKDFPRRLESAGFEVEIVQYVKQFSLEELKRYGLDGSEDIYLCRK